MWKQNLIPKLGLLGLATHTAYLYVLYLNRPIADAATLFNAAFSLLTLGPTLLTWFLALFRARANRSWGWFLLILFFWPISFVYTLAVDTGPRPNNSSKPTPLRVAA